MRLCIEALKEMTSPPVLGHAISSMKRNLQLFLLTGWLAPIAFALIYFGRWLTEIVIPTLKGGDFDQLYDLHQVRYLDTTLVCTVIAFVWAALAVCRWARKQVFAP